MKEYQKEIIEYAQAFDNITQRLDAIFDASSREQEDDRVLVFREYLNLYKQKPIFGNGLGAAISNQWVGDTHALSSHNQFLNYMVDFGIVGMIIILYFLWSLFYYEGNLLLYQDGLAFAVIFIVGTFTNHLMFNTPSFLFVYAMFGRLIHLEYEKEHSALTNLRVV